MHCRIVDTALLRRLYSNMCFVIFDNTYYPANIFEQSRGISFNPSLSVSVLYYLSIVFIYSYTGLIDWIKINGMR